MTSKSNGAWNWMVGGCLLLVLAVFVGAVAAWLHYYRGAQDQRSAPAAAAEQPLDDIQPDEVQMPEEEIPAAEAPAEGGQPLVPPGPAKPPGQTAAFAPSKMQAAIDALGEWATARADAARLEALARRQGFAAGYELSAYCGVALAVGARIRAGDPEAVQREYARIYPPEVVAVIARPGNLEKIGQLVPSE